MQQSIPSGSLPAIPRPTLPPSSQTLYGPDLVPITARVRHDEEPPTGLVCEVCIGPRLHVVMARCRVNKRIGLRLDHWRGDCPHVDFIDIAVPRLSDDDDRLITDRVIKAVDARFNGRFASVSLEPEGFRPPGHLLTVRSDTNAPIVVVAHEGEAVKLDHVGLAERAYIEVSVPRAVFGKSLIARDPIPPSPLTARQ